MRNYIKSTTLVPPIRKSEYQWNQENQKVGVMMVDRKEKWRLIWPYALILLLHCIAIFVFTRGFLLTRTELPFYSHCSDVSQSPCQLPDADSSSAADRHYRDRDVNNGTRSDRQRCWTKPIVDRVVIIVLDALRFDFVAPSACFEETKPWMDKLTVLQELAAKQGSQARIFKAIADPPTTSLQRLKGLTTGGLPTFIDVGNSFGAPAIVEDNLIYQLVQNGKNVVMMGDDTWVQLFPNHFGKSYPFPSFNVKDLDTVDNGCIEHLIPSLYQEDWDVLIAHFLGVDHAGHIFGVDSIQMTEKLEQYNVILEKVIKELQSQSEHGGLHENTLLLVMGDHGQTLNGDHGGGTPEETETSVFAMSFKKPSTSVPSGVDYSSNDFNKDKTACMGSVQQLDFAVTISALLGIPFPFGSIGHVDSELYSLGAGISNLENFKRDNIQDSLRLEEWMENYVNVLCINSWQVKKYIDIYSSSSVIGFSSEDLSHIADMYAQAEEHRSHSAKQLLLSKNGSSFSTSSVLKGPIDAYIGFLASVAELARSKWTEFNLRMMAAGFVIMLVSLGFHFAALKKVNKPRGNHFPSLGYSDLYLGIIMSLLLVIIRACSFLSNSYILEEGKVANFLLATTIIIKLHFSIMKKKILLETIGSLALLSFLRFTIELGLSKQAATSAFMNFNPSWMLWISNGHPTWLYMTDITPILAMLSLIYLLYKTIASSSRWSVWKTVITGNIFSYILIALHWALESEPWTASFILEGIGKNYIPRVIYTIGLLQLVLLLMGRLFIEENTSECGEMLFIKTVAMLSTWSPTIIILSGKQGPLVALTTILGGYCLMKLENLHDEIKNGTVGYLPFHLIPVTQWSLLATCLFFCTGHWCAFDGLRYPAAFIGFDEFVLLRQAALLTIDTFGFSHILPIFGLPLLVCTNLFGPSEQRKQVIFSQLSKVYLMYGMIMATTTTFTMICVSIQRRHLMVWGLFAPKFVFDVVSLILGDVLILVASLFYFTGERHAKTQ